MLSDQDEEKIAIEVQKVNKDGKITKRLLAAEIIHYRRSLRSHTDLVGKMIKKYQEAPDVTNQLKGIIEGKNGVGGTNVLHFVMLQVP